MSTKHSLSLMDGLKGQKCPTEVEKLLNLPKLTYEFERKLRKWGKTTLAFIKEIFGSPF